MKTSALRRLRTQLKAIQETAGEDTTVTQALVLLEIALHPGEKLTHLTEYVPGDLTHTAVSRAVDVMGSHQGRNTRRVPSGLVERRDILDDRRAVGLWLTKKGEKLMEKLAG